MMKHALSLKHWLSLALLLLAIIIASIQPLEMASYILHQVGTLLMVIMLIFWHKKIGLNFSAFFLYICFLLIHISAAHYLYSYVPYNDWVKALFNFDLNQAMGWERNMYDRLVHFLFGLFLYPFFYRLFEVWLPQVKSFALFLLVVQFIMASSLFYEWIEWLIAVGLSPEEAEKYNGQQGDIWDAHKDMLFATIGSILTGAFLLASDKYSNKQKAST